MRDKNQVFIFNDAELRLIKVTFADNEALIYSIRKILLQFPLTPAEKALVQQAMTPEVFAIVKKRIYPDLDPDAPLTQISDYRAIVTTDLKTKPSDEHQWIVDVMQVCMDYLEGRMQQLQNLDRDEKYDVHLADLRAMNANDAYTKRVYLKAYLDILGYVDPQLNHLRVIAGMKEETPEEQKKRLTRESNK